MEAKVTRLDYCQYLLVSQINYTLTNFADHCEQFSHDTINRYLRGEQITPRLVWENVRGQVVPTPVATCCLMTRCWTRTLVCHRVGAHQYSGNAKQVIKGIGVVTCVYVNPALDLFWLIDYRIYAPTATAKASWIMCGIC